VTTNTAIVFDFDGVLADTEGLHLRAFQDALAARGWTLGRDEYFERYLGYDDRGLFAAFAADTKRSLSSAEVEALVLDKAMRYEQRVATGSVLFDGAIETVARLEPRHRLGIASGSLHGEIVAILAANGLTDAIRVVIGADDVRRSKPAPDPYATAVAALGVPASRAVAIEDSRWGLMSARAAGLRTIGLTTSYSAEALDCADVVLRGLEDVTTDLVQSLLGVK
jgi:HAD superfamily hydrolase (TIGR01509 family)